MIDCRKVNLKKGSTGSEVRELQIYLRALGFYKRQIDGDYGYYTVEAVKKLQKKQGNTADGWFGPKTCSKSDLNKKVGVGSTSTETNLMNVKELLINFRKQPTYTSCGPASLANAFSYYDVKTDIYDLIKICKTNNNGTTPQNLVNAVPQINKDYILFEEDFTNFERIVEILNNNNPIIAQIQTTKNLGYMGSYGHYICITGYNKSSRQVKIADPSRTIKWIPFIYLIEAIKKRLKISTVKSIKILKKKKN